MEPTKTKNHHATTIGFSAEDVELLNKITALLKEKNTPNINKRIGVIRHCLTSFYNSIKPS